MGQQQLASQARPPAPCHHVAMALAGLLLVERLRFKSVDQDDDTVLELGRQHVDLGQMARRTLTAIPKCKASSRGLPGGQGG